MTPAIGAQQHVREIVSQVRLTPEQLLLRRVKDPFEIVALGTPGGIRGEVKALH
jgi:hypothetical protein